MNAFSRLARPLKVATLLGLAVWLAACSSDGDKKKAANCPYAAVLAPASSLTVFMPGKTDDPNAELYRVGISGVKTACVLDADNGTTDSTLELTFKAHRAIAGKDVGYRVPYFVAVSLGSKVLAKNEFWVNFSFPSGDTEAEFTDDVGSTHINLQNGKKPYDYEIVAGMQLTHEQLEYNKKMSRYAP